MEQQRWLQGLLDSIQQFSRMAAPQMANRRYEDACLPPVELSTAERVRKMGQKQFTELVPPGQVLDLSRSLRHVQKEPKEEVTTNSRAAEFTAKLPTNTPVLKMLERQRVAEKEQPEESTKTVKPTEVEDAKNDQQPIDEKPPEKAEDKILINGDVYTVVKKNLSNEMKVVEQKEQTNQKEDEKIEQQISLATPKTETKLEINNECSAKKVFLFNFVLLN